MSTPTPIQVPVVSVPASATVASTIDAKALQEGLTATSSVLPVKENAPESPHPASVNGNKVTPTGHEMSVAIIGRGESLNAQEEAYNNDIMFLVIILVVLFFLLMILAGVLVFKTGECRELRDSLEQEQKAHQKHHEPLSTLATVAATEATSQLTSAIRASSATTTQSVPVEHHYYHASAPSMAPYYHQQPYHYTMPPAAMQGPPPQMGAPMYPTWR